MSVAVACTGPNPSYKTDLTAHSGGASGQGGAAGQGGGAAGQGGGTPGTGGVTPGTGGAGGLDPGTGGAGGEGGSMMGSGGAPTPDGGMPDSDAGTPNPDTDLLSGLIGYWRMDEAANATVVRDSSGLRNDGTLEAVAGASTWVAGRFGSALHFSDNDVNIGVLVPTTARISGLTRYTVAAWVRRSRLRPLAYQSIISRQLGTGYGEVFDMSVSKDILQAYGPDRNDQGVTAASTGRTAPVNTWFHAAATFDGQKLRIYQDGVLEGTVNQPLALPSTTTPVYLGTNKNHSATSNDHHPWEGDLDEILLYDVALPTAAIGALARGERPPVP